MTASGAVIRPFEHDDIPALQAIRQAAFVPVFRSFRTIVGEQIAEIVFADADAEQARLLDDICSGRSADHLLVMTIGSEVVGFVSYRIDAGRRTGEIGLNAVHPDHAGKGLGTSMYKHVIAQMRDLGLALVTVGTGGDASHAAARRAYEKAGLGPALPFTQLYKLL